MRVLAGVLLVAGLLLAGCASAPAQAPAAAQATPHLATSVLAGTVEPAAFDAPTFKDLGAVATGGPAFSAGEPSIRSALDGTLYVAFPGCDTTVSARPVTPLPGQDACAHGVVYKSTDTGASWTKLNRKGDGRLGPDGPAANGDAEVAVDAAGTIYASNLGSGIQVHKSMDGGATWTYAANVVPKGESADRQWNAAAEPGHVAIGWMGSLKDEARSVIVNATFDGGATWTGAVALGHAIGWIGPLQFSPDAQHLYAVWTQPEAGEGVDLVLFGQKTCDVLVARSDDGGRSFATFDTGARIHTNLQGGHWSCVNMAPAMDVTGDGSVVVAWSEDVESPGDVTAQGAVIKAVVSHDAGQSWTPTFQLSNEPAAIMPWVSGGAGDRFAVTYFSDQVPADPDYGAAIWDLKAVYVDGAGDAAKIQRVLIDDDVHEGGICTRGGACTTTASDRFMLDFFQNDLLPDGRLVVAYPANPASQARVLEIRFAVQDGGTPLLERTS